MAKITFAAASGGLARGGSTMAPLYAHCPRCRFPVVIHAVEREVPRRCRQCGGLYVPAAPEVERGRPSGPRGSNPPRNPRRGLRARLKRGWL